MSPKEICVAEHCNENVFRYGRCTYHFKKLTVQQRTELRSQVGGRLSAADRLLTPQPSNLQHKDMLLEMLERSYDTWQATAQVPHKEKLAAAKELAQYGVYSANQLAKITRLSVPTITRHLEIKGNAGGRFSPETLTALIQLRKFVFVGEPIPKNILKVIAENGTTMGTAAKLTGTIERTLYGRLNGV